jgi:hypothetical protein
MPMGGLAVGAGGTLFGVGQTAGPVGAVFSLQPPATAGGQWMETTIVSYSVLLCPEATLAIDAGGVLYGTDVCAGPDEGGAVFSVTPPAATGGSWTATLIYDFPRGSGSFCCWCPVAGVVVGPGGVLLRHDRGRCQPSSMVRHSLLFDPARVSGRTLDGKHTL